MKTHHLFEHYNCKTLNKPQHKTQKTDSLVPYCKIQLVVESKIQTFEIKIIIHHDSSLTHFYYHTAFMKHLSVLILLVAQINDTFEEAVRFRRSIVVGY